MKTLDEVIKALGICDETVTANCPDCPYDLDCENVPGEDLRADALNYLKMYKSDKKELDSTRLAYIDVLTDYVAMKQYWAEQQENPPLTWDELMGMEGKPVWVEYDIEHKDRTLLAWCLVLIVLDENMSLVTNAIAFSVKKSELGTRWQAYRKERG